MDPITSTLGGAGHLPPYKQPIAEETQSGASGYTRPTSPYSDWHQTIDTTFGTDVWDPEVHGYEDIDGLLKSIIGPGSPRKYTPSLPPFNLY